MSLSYEVVFNLGGDMTRVRFAEITDPPFSGPRLTFTRGCSEMDGLLANKLLSSEFIQQVLFKCHGTPGPPGQDDVTCSALVHLCVGGSQIFPHRGIYLHIS